MNPSTPDREPLKGDVSSDGQRRILCAEDNPQIGELLVRLLQREGFAVEWATDGRDAWEKLSRDLRRYCLVITDHQMPELNGGGLVERLRKAGYPGKIVVYSSPLRSPDRLNYMILGVDRMVEKSASPQELVRAVHELTAELE